MASRMGVSVRAGKAELVASGSAISIRDVPLSLTISVLEGEIPKGTLRNITMEIIIDNNLPKDQNLLVKSVSEGILGLSIRPLSSNGNGFNGFPLGSVDGRKIILCVNFSDVTEHSFTVNYSVYLEVKG